MGQDPFEAFAPTAAGDLVLIKRLQESQWWRPDELLAHQSAGDRPLWRQHRSEFGGRRHARTAGRPTVMADHHAVGAVIKWVEQGVAPEKLIATKFNAAGTLTLSRPVCAYPAEAVYNGSGDTNDGANFSCQTPKLQERTVTSRDLVNIRNSLTQRAVELSNR